MSWSIAFLGTNHPAVPSLDMLAEKSLVKVVILPQNAGDKNESLIDICNRFNIPFFYSINEIEQFEINLIIAANYPQIVPKRFLNKYPCVNTHWSDLPKYRGVHGTAWSLINEDYNIACTIHWMADEFDTGDVIKKEFVTVNDDMSIYELHNQLAQSQAKGLEDLLVNFSSVDEWPTEKQDEKKSTYVPQRYPDDGLIDWSWNTGRIWNFIRALQPPVYPGAFTFFKQKKIIITEAKPVDCPTYFSNQGQVVRVVKNQGVWVKTGDKCILVKKVQFENEEPIDAFNLLKRGDKLGFDYLEEIRLLQNKIILLEEKIKKIDGSV